MAVRPGADEYGPVWTAECDTPGCGAYFVPVLTARNEKDLRYLARKAGWRLPSSAKNRAKCKPDLCPDCRAKVCELRAAA